MFGRKKSKNNNEERNVVAGPRAAVFSYRAKRDQEERGRERAGGASANSTKSQRRPGSQRRGVVYGSCIIILLAFLFTTTLRQPSVAVHPSSAFQTVLKKENYDKGVSEVFGNNMLARSKLFIDSSKLSNQIQEKFPEVRRATVVVPLFGMTPQVVIELAEPSFAITGNGGRFIMDERGKLIIDARDVIIPSDLLTIEDQSGLEFSLGSKALTKNDVEFITTFVIQLNIAGIAPKSLRLPVAAGEVHILLKDKPYYIKANLQGSAKQQVGAYLAAKGKIEGPPSPVREYVDVRVEERLFFK